MSYEYSDSYDWEELIDTLNNQVNKISDLEAKLEELREQITICDEENSKTFMKSVNAWRENAELKQQLAEKEKENELMAKTLKMTKFFEKEVNQDKISFAVEKLEKVKDYNYTLRFGSSAINEFIDNQIKQLKEIE